MRFPRVEKEFRVISNDTRTVIVDGDLIQRLEQRKSVDWREIQNGSVQIWGYRLESMRIEEFSNYPGLYRWNYPYDEFIGHMAGILPIEKALHNSGGFIL